VFGDPTIADAILDRLVHTAHRIALDGETLRKPQEKSGKRSKLETGTAEGTPESRRRDRCPGSPERCPRSIGISVRNQSERLSAIPGIRNSFHQRGFARAGIADNIDMRETVLPSEAERLAFATKIRKSEIGNIIQVHSHASTIPIDRSVRRARLYAWLATSSETRNQLPRHKLKRGNVGSFRWGVSLVQFISFSCSAL
jgi:IstB-like ATP binding protein